jgi:hypothetical protein
LVAGGVASSSPSPTLERWIPPVSTTWQWQLTGPLDLSVDVLMYDVDLFDTPAATVKELHRLGRKAICYISAGTREDWRPDAARFPAAVVGARLEGWTGERWLDIRRIDLIGPIIEARLDLCRDKGFDGVEPDNIDGYANRSGFPLAAADQLRFNKWIAAAAHARGLSVGLKNDLDQTEDLVADFDWALNEQCFEYKECDRLAPFTKAGKAVFVVEYSLPAASFCEEARTRRFNALRKRLSLDAHREACASPPASPKNVRIIR